MAVPRQERVGLNPARSITLTPAQAGCAHGQCSAPEGGVAQYGGDARFVNELFKLDGEQAAAEGAKILKPVEDQFYGDRSGFIQDPFGHLWGIATHVEDVSPQEIKERMKKMVPAA